MIEFLARNEVATRERLVNRFAFNVLPFSEYNTVFVGAPSHVLAANSVALKGNPIRMTTADDDHFIDALVVDWDTHKRETGHIRIICDTLEEVIALMNTRLPIQKIIKKNEGYVDPSETGKQIEAIYSEVRARFNTPKEVAPKAVMEERPAAGDAMIARVSARLERLGRIEPARPAMPARVVSNQPAVFGRRV